MLTDFIKLLDILADNEVEFVVVGGLAAVAHGSSQVTQDIDICISLEPGNLDKLKNALQELHPIHRIGNKQQSFTETGESLYSFKNIYLSTDYGQLDCLGEIKGIGRYDEVVKNSFQLDIEGKVYNFLTLDALIEAKKAVNRQKDRESIIILEALKEKSKKL